VIMDERLSWDKHIDSICSKVGAGIGAMWRVKLFVPLSTTKKLYNAIFFFCCFVFKSKTNITTLLVNIYKCVQIHLKITNRQRRERDWSTHARRLPVKI
jgi:hypothetical protein